MWDSKISSLPTPRCEASAFYQPRKPRASKTQGETLNFQGRNRNRQQFGDEASQKELHSWEWSFHIPYPRWLFRVNDDFPLRFSVGPMFFSFPRVRVFKSTETQQVFDWFASTVAKWAGVVCTWVVTPLTAVGFFIKSHTKKSEEFQMTQQGSWWITNPKKCTIFPEKFGTLKFFPYICCHCLIFVLKWVPCDDPCSTQPKQKKKSSKGTWLAFVASKDRPKGTSGASATQAPASHVLKKSPKDLEMSWFSIVLLGK